MKLAALAVILFLVVIAGFELSGPGDIVPALIGSVALCLLLELPGAWLMVHGARRLRAALLIYGLPLLAFEIWEFRSWMLYCPCGDKEIQPLLMTFVIPILVVITGTLVLVPSLIARPAGPPD